ncbi:MAG: polyprenyl synthetase family protein [Balneolaceae bacterium]|nr:polyprenyl synthetase family protein [Balneolaceae bacterium]
MNKTLRHQQLFDLIQQGLDQLNLPDTPGLLYDPVRYTLELSGKRVRPYFTLLGCGMCGGNVRESIPAALSMELLHNFTLLHDDIMDAAETRRGKPSVFKKWDPSTAILSGDVMFTCAFEQLQYYGTDDRYAKQQYAAIIDIFLDSAKRVCEGQAYDLEFEQRDRVTVEEYLEMVKGKTAALISGSLMLGGAVAGADNQALKQLNDLGTAAGSAFQIQDDLLDLFADPSKFGKTPGGDIMEGKKTYLSILALQRGNKRQRNELREILGVKDATEEEIRRVVSIYKELGVVDETREKIAHLYGRAEDLMERFPSTEYREELLNYLLKLKNREF